jgi:phospholipase/carboxylesterase
MSLYVGLRRAHPVAGIVAYSGRLIGVEALAAEIRAKPPVLLVHGDADAVVPFQSLAHGEAALAAHGVPVEILARPGLGHGIDEEGLTAGARFLKEVLGS